MRRDSNGREDGNFCPNCASSCFVEDHSRGDTICSNCGLCLPELMMAEAPDRRTFLGDAKDHNQHFRVDPFFDLAGYSTVIPERRLNRLQHRLQLCGASMQQRNLVSGFAHISAFGAMFELPKVVTDTAKQMLFEFSKRIDGVNFGSDSFALSVCYLALEKHLCGKPIREVAAVSGIEEKSLRKCLKMLRKTIPHLLVIQSGCSSAEISKIQAFVQNIVQQLQLAISVENLAMEIAKRALNERYEEFGGKRPSTIAAACVHLAGKQLNVAIEPEDIAVCAAVSTSRMMKIAQVIKVKTEL